MSIKYKLKRLRVKLRRSKEKNLEYLDDVQKRAYDLTIEMIHDKDSELMYDPEHGRRGVRNDDVFVEIRANKIRIANSVSHDDVPIDDRIHDSLVIKFNSKMSRKFNAIENQFIDKAKNRLDVIKDGISKK